MIRTAWVGKSSSVARRAFIVGGAVLFAGACGGNGSKGTSSCATGSESCACYGNGTCDDGLVCASKLCVSLANGGMTSKGGASSAGNASTSGGVTALGGSLGNGGDVASAGFPPSNGGAPIAGSGSDVGGTTALGGGTSNGGTSNGGTSNGGASIAGASKGGMSNGAAGAANGGDPSVGGAAGAGGGVSNGGVPMVAGQTSTGGAPVTQICGNGILEGTETCDPLPPNADLGDGCTPTCMAEPTCPAAGGPCTSKCGDGLVFDNEACDDGNTASGDGCSATCTVEPNYQCTQPPMGETMVVPMVVRDFNAGGDFEKGTGFTSLNYANQGLLQTTLDGNGLKPALASTTGTYYGTSGKASGIASPSSFAQWYDDNAPASGNTHTATAATPLTLYLKSDGSGYVNRFGNNGDGLTSTRYNRTIQQYCGAVNQSDHDAAGTAIPCTLCPFDSDTTTPQCDPPYPTSCQTDATYTGECVQSGSTWYGVFLRASLDGNPLWFPADGMTPFSPSGVAQIPGYYDAAWPTEPGSPKHNFSFTTEVRYWFKYDSTQTYKLRILGDDDIWLFVNKRLAVDMGGIHAPVLGELTISSGVASTSVSPTEVTGATAITNQPDLGSLQHGNVYEIAVFHAERQTTSSSYQISLMGFNTARSVCTRQ